MSDPMPPPHDPRVDPQQPPPSGEPPPRKSAGLLVSILILIAILVVGWYFYGQDGSVEPPTTAPAVDIGSGQGPAADRGRDPADQTQAAVAAPGDRAATPIARMRPSYPPTALRDGKEGTVLLRVEVDAEGYVGDVEVARLSTSPELDQAAVSAVREWTFEPAIRGGQPVASTVEVPVEFKVDSP